jgi:16S rRNA (guanine1516-N2)-methyltransferase
MINGNNTLTIGVQAAIPAQYNRASSLAAKLKIPLAEKDTEDFQLLLICSADSLTLKQTGKNSPGPINANFTDSTMAYRLKHGGGRKQDLARAIGLKKGWQPTIIDATAGLGRDGFVLAHLNCIVHMLERSPILAVMLEDSLMRARQDKQLAETANRIKLTNTDSREFLPLLKPEEKPDVIYLDPMYPERTKSSLVKKEMRILRSLTGDDSDAGELLNIALQFALNRVVVKRPRLAPTLDDIEPSHSITGKTSRFDVYLI